MKLKNISFILCIVLLIGVLSGCSTKDSKKTEAEIKQNIIGGWNAGSGYMMFFENGEMALFNADTHNGEMMQYEVKGNTVILYAKATTLKLESVDIKGDTLTYISEQGNKIIWKAVSDEEVMAAIE